MSITVASFTTPAGNVVPVLKGTSFQASFINKAEFAHAPGESCGPAEYRQYVMGQFVANGSVLSHILCGSVILSDTAFQEDGCPSGSCTAYGHRSCPSNSKDKYTPDQKTGSEFYMEDEPGFVNVKSGYKYSIELSFKGTLSLVATGSILATKNWTANGQTTVSSLEQEAHAIAITADDKIMHARVTRNLESGHPECHLVIRRRVGQPPLDPTSIQAKFKDSSGREIATLAPVVHELAGYGRNTATVVFPLRPESPAPASLDISLLGGTLSLQLGKS